MTATIILGFLWLALASVILRVVLFFAGSDKNGRLAKAVSAIGSAGFLPLTAFEWMFNIAMLGLLLFTLAYWTAPDRVTNVLADTFGLSGKTERPPASHRP